MGYIIRINFVELSNDSASASRLQSHPQRTNIFFWHTPIVIDTLLLPMQPCTDTGKNRIGQSVVTDDDADVDAYFRTGKNPRQSPFGRSENVHAKGKSIPFNYKLKFSHIFIFFFPQHTEIINGAKSGIFTNQEP